MNFINLEKIALEPHQFKPQLYLFIPLLICSIGIIYMLSVHCGIIVVNNC